MSSDDLTFVQRCTLITLMAENREVANAELTSVFRLSLKADQREILRRRKLIDVRQERKGRPAFLELTDDGWARAAAELGATTPERAGAGGAALYRVLAKLRVYLDRANIAPADFFGVSAASPPTDEIPAVEIPAVETVVAADDLETLIRKAYGALARKAGDYVMLSRVRQRLGGVPPAQVDAALVQLNRAPDVSIIPESNQKALSPEERAASVVIGNQNKHLIAIGP